MPESQRKEAYKYYLCDLDKIIGIVNNRLDTYINPPKRKNLKRISIPKGLRFEVFKRDNYTCLICGKNKNTHNVAIEIDHINPVSKGGTDDMENLQTLCYDCNREKTDLSMKNDF